MPRYAMTHGEKFLFPLSGEAEEWVTKHSDGRVSFIIHRPNQLLVFSLWLQLSAFGSKP
jgi:hypothetical protein